MGNIFGCRPTNPESRIIDRHGANNICTVGIQGRHRRLLQDLFTTLVETRWRWNVLLFFGCIVIVWLLFALYYWVVCNFHGDFMERTNDGQQWKPCVQNVNSFVTAYLFSVETQSTIGYGFRRVTEECPPAYFGVMLQSVVGVCLQAALAGLVVAKVRRSKKRSQTVMFSKVACIAKEDSRFRLSIRVGDMRDSHIIGAHATGILVKKISNSQNRNVPVQYYPVPFTTALEGGRIFLAWPALLEHTVDEASPFWNMSSQDVLQENFELQIFLEGVVSSTGQAIQIKTSYLPQEIRWGHRFVSLGEKIDYYGRFEMNYKHFDMTYPVHTPTVESDDERSTQSCADLAPCSSVTPRDGDPQCRGGAPSRRLKARRHSILDTYLGNPDIEAMMDT